MIDYTPVPELCTTNLIVPRWVVRNTRWEQRLKQGLDARDRDAEKLADRCVAAGLPGPFMLCTGSWGRWLEWENHTHRLEVQPHYPTGLGNPTVLQVSLTRLPPPLGTGVRVRGEGRHQESCRCPRGQPIMSSNPNPFRGPFDKPFLPSVGACTTSLPSAS